jgi:hypothetical protein
MQSFSNKRLRPDGQHDEAFPPHVPDPAAKMRSVLSPTAAVFCASLDDHITKFMKARLQLIKKIKKNAGALDNLIDGRDAGTFPKSIQHGTSFVCHFPANQEDRAKEIEGAIALLRKQILDSMVESKKESLTELEKELDSFVATKTKELFDTCDHSDIDEDKQALKDWCSTDFLQQIAVSEAQFGFKERQELLAKEDQDMANKAQEDQVHAMVDNNRKTIADIVDVKLEAYQAKMDVRFDALLKAIGNKNNNNNNNKKSLNQKRNPQSGRSAPKKKTHQKTTRKKQNNSNNNSNKNQNQNHNHNQNKPKSSTKKQNNKSSKKKGQN